MTLTNVEREEMLRIFAELYSDRDFNVMVEHMPSDINDPEGQSFSDYFDFLQSLYSLRSDIKSFTNVQFLDDRINILERRASEFGFPVDLMLEAFRG